MATQKKANTNEDKQNTPIFIVYTAPSCELGGVHGMITEMTCLLYTHVEDRCRDSTRSAVEARGKEVVILCKLYRWQIHRA